MVEEKEGKRLVDGASTPTHQTAMMASARAVRGRVSVHRGRMGGVDDYDDDDDADDDERLARDW